MATAIENNGNILKGHKILITGATGYLGSWMAEYAYRAGANVRILARQIPPYLAEWAKKFEVILGSLEDQCSLSQSLKNRELVWHTASANETVCATDFQKAIQINVAGTMKLLEEAANHEIKQLIKFSTFHVYGYEGTNPITEETLPFPKTVYGLTNLMGDLAATFYRQTKKLNAVVVRISNGYGIPLFRDINRWSLLINSLCLTALREKKITLKSSGLPHRDFVSIQDIFQGMVLLSTNTTNHPIFNLGGENSYSVLEIACLIKKIFDEKYHTNIPLTPGEKKADEKENKVYYSISHLKELGFKPQNRLTTEIKEIFELLEKKS